MCKFSPGDTELEVTDFNVTCSSVSCSFFIFLNVHWSTLWGCVCMMTASSDLWSPISHITHILVQHQSVKRHQCYAQQLVPFGCLTVSWWFWLLTGCCAGISWSWARLWKPQIHKRGSTGLTTHIRRSLGLIELCFNPQKGLCQV